MRSRRPQSHESKFAFDAASSVVCAGHWRRARVGLLLPVLAAAALGCAVGPDYKRPEVDLPQAWNEAEVERSAVSANAGWWEQFGDPQLDSLIAIALVENKDLGIAAARIDQYAARLRITGSSQYPQITYDGGAGRAQRSQEGPVPIRRDEERVNDYYSASLGVDWELDLWKRIGRAKEADRAELLSAVEERQALVLSLVSAVATSYVELLSLDRELEITRQIVAYRAQWLDVFEKKGTGGQVSGLELAQVRSSYQQAAVKIPRIELQIALAENALSVLVGRNPGSIPRGKTIDTLGTVAVPKGIPSDVLTARPDVRAKEQTLIAANARIGAVRAQYFPRFSLTGLFGFASTDISTWIQESASLWSAGLNVVGPLFKGGRIKGEVREAEAVREQMLYDYLKTIQVALREVEDSLTSIRRLRELLAIQDQEIAALEEYATVARNRYDAGYATSYLEILDADRNLYNARIEQTRTRRDLFDALVTSYKAMGGGWEAPAAPVEH